VNRATGVFGKGTLADTLLLQKAVGIKRNGYVGLNTWQAVDPQMRAYERLLLKLKKPPQPPIGERIAHEMTVMLGLGMDYYSQVRPAATNLVAWKRRDDCSGSALLAWCLAKARKFSGLGNTQWIWDNGKHVSEADVQLGDQILYGSGGVTKHVATVDNVKLKTGIGFGSAPGRRLPWRYRGDLMGFRRLE
jgi:hypothetical protein